VLLAHLLALLVEHLRHLVDQLLVLIASLVMRCIDPTSRPWKSASAPRYVPAGIVAGEKKDTPSTACALGLLVERHEE
jgi:hypothetical protein